VGGRAEDAGGTIEAGSADGPLNRFRWGRNPVVSRANTLATGEEGVTVGWEGDGKRREGVV